MLTNTAVRLFMFGFLKILALLLAFFFLDRERREPAEEHAQRSVKRWLRWPIVASLVVACGAEGYDAYLKYSDAAESAEKTERLLTSIERTSQPFFPVNIQGTYAFDLRGARFAPLRKAKERLVTDGYVTTDQLFQASTKVLDEATASLFDTSIRTHLFFMRDSNPSISLSAFASARFPENRIELSLSVDDTPTACRPWEGRLVTPSCGWVGDTLTVPIMGTTIDRSSHRAYVHGPIAYFQDLAGSILIVRSCVEERPFGSTRLNAVRNRQKRSAEPPLVQVIKSQDAPIDLKELILSTAGSNTFRLTPSDKMKGEDGCAYDKFVFGKSRSQLEAQLER